MHMAITMKKIITIWQIIRLKQVMKHWKARSLKHKLTLSDSSSTAASPPLGQEEYGFKCNGGIGLPCEVDLFEEVLKFLVKDEMKYGSLEPRPPLKPTICPSASENGTDEGVRSEGIEISVVLRIMLQQLSNSQVCFAPRNSNSVADELAKRGLQLEGENVVWSVF
ncbi:hypothetical protein EZV62_027869 [Acer yangbiense]|uniref:Uncharacterized protein n=1 Tax=Acer yangbiense TaxID=1000413 RepID=A0A5C7GPY4_9ROSI|nr:hypothetical protein EZV62_027869 [Acer yangbiense]